MDYEKNNMLIGNHPTTKEILKGVTDDCIISIQFTLISKAKQIYINFAKKWSC